MNAAAASLLLREPPLVVLPSLAKAIGLNAALLLQQIHFRSLDQADGWVQRTRRAWVQEFPFWSEDIVKRTLTELRDRGLIDAEYVQTSTGREPRYRVRYEGVEALEGVGAKSPDGSGRRAPTGRGGFARGRSFKGRRANDGEVQSSSETTTAPTGTTASLSSQSSSTRARARRADDRNDDPAVVVLCERLAARMRGNDPRASVPRDQSGWRRAMRLLLDDGRSVEEVELVIDWCQSHRFWRSRIRSPRKLREQFGGLWLERAAALEPSAPKTAVVDEVQARLEQLAGAAGRDADVIDGTASEVA